MNLGRAESRGGGGEDVEENGGVEKKKIRLGGKREIDGELLGCNG